jgi:hypothetical protein
VSASGHSGPATADIADHCRRFAAYARSFDSGRAHEDRYLRLKEEHSRKVLALAERIAASEADFSSPVMRRAVMLAALYHDIARFPQYARFHTFSDPRSFNHGAMGNRELGRLHLLAGEDAPVRRLVRSAVLLHNRSALPPALPADTRQTASALRDADKLDILRVMEEALRPGVPPDPTILLHVDDSPACNPRILEAVQAGHMALYSDLRSTTDFRILLCSWFYDLNYRSSRRIAARSGLYRALLAPLPDRPELKAFADRFHAELDRAAS